MESGKEILVFTFMRQNDKARCGIEMTVEQEQTIERIGRELKLTFPDMHGNIQFNMNPDIKEVRVKVVDDIRFKK